MKPRVRPRFIAFLGAVGVLAVATGWRDIGSSAPAVPPATPMAPWAEPSEAGPPATPLPARLARLVLPVEGNDPFAGVSVPDPRPRSASEAVREPAWPRGAGAPETPAPTREPEPLQASAPVDTTAPPLGYRYLGSFVASGGPFLAYIANGDFHHEIRTGSELPDGYTVESIGPDAIRLRHPRLDRLAEIPMPRIDEAGG